MNYLIKKALLGYGNLLFPFISIYRDLKRPYVKGELKKIPFYLSFDLDYSKDIKSLPKIFDILNKHGIKATFACIGKMIEQYPDEHRSIVYEGHEIMNHTYSHPDNDEINPHEYYRKLSKKEQYDEIKKMQDVSERILKYRPIGFRLPHFGNVVSVDMDNLYNNLKKLDMVYDSSLLKFNIPKGVSDIYETKTKGIVEFSINTCPYHPFASCDSWHIFRSKRYVYKIIHKFKTFESTFIKMIDICYKKQEIINVYLDPCDLVDNGSLEVVIEHAKKYCDFYTYTEYFNKNGQAHFLRHFQDLSPVALGA